MLGKGWQIYKETRKKHDLVFNVYVMRPIAAQVVALVAPTGVTPNQLTILNLFVFLLAIVLLVLLPTQSGALVAIFVLELSYCFDCADGMLARHKKLASKEGHLFDFFTDEVKALLLAALLPVRLYRTGGLAFATSLPPAIVTWPAHAPGFLLAGITGAIVLASAVSLTNFVRRPELSGKASTVEAHYETVDHALPKSVVGKVGWAVTTFLRFLNHYPSHIWIFALAGRLDVFFWMYVAINGLYLARGWAGILVRFGR